MGLIEIGLHLELVLILAIIWIPWFIVISVKGNKNE